MNVKLLIFAGLLLCTGLSVSAQSSKGGLPLSLGAGLPVEAVPVHTYPLPEASAFLQAQPVPVGGGPVGLLRPEYAGVPVGLDLSFPASGGFTASAEAGLIWQAKVRIPGAPAIGLYYDRFFLPAGVELFLRNGSGSQILGAYTENNNSEADFLFATEAVQGEEVTLELNIEPGVDLSTIQLHLNRALAYFRGIRYLEKYAQEAPAFQPVQGTSDPYGWLVGGASKCMINAHCPPGSAYGSQGRSAIQLLLPEADGSVSYCSGTLVNNTGNTEGENCKNYILTASHCETGGGTTNATFSQHLIRFNFTYTDCSGDSLSEVRTLTGADFVARTPWPQNPVETGMPDFLLLQLREGVPESWGAYLSGWDRNPTMPLSLNAPEQYTIFHHPSGDVRKVSYNRQMTSGPNAWSFDFPVNGSQGGIAPGSSGSGLLNADKLLIGITSVAGHPEFVCESTTTGEAADFFSWTACYKLSSAWEWGSRTTAQLRPWLDPANSGVMRLTGRPACVDKTSSVTHTDTRGGAAIAVSPNPSSDGVFKVQFQFGEAERIYVEVYAVSGKRVAAYQLRDATSGSRTLDLSGLAKGLYLVKFYFGAQAVSKKVVIR